MLIKITLDKPITPLVQEIQPRVCDLIKKPPEVPKLSATVECVNDFKNDLVLIMESIAIEY
jgi:hypothetical protein